MAGVVGIHSLKKEYDVSGKTVSLGTLAYILMRSNQHRGSAFLEVQTKGVIVGQEGRLSDKEDTFAVRFQNAYKSSTIVADLRKGKASPRSINVSGSAFDGYCVDEKGLQEFYENPNLNGYQILSKILAKNPRDDPYGAMDIYSKYMRGNMIIQTDNGFVAIKDKTGRAPLFAAIHPESGLFMVSSENCSESIFNGQVSDDNDASFKDALDIDGKVFKEVEPGTMIRAENGNVRIFHSEDVNPLVTPHELVYTMHPASTFKEKHVGYWREKIGERIADTYKDQMKGYEVVFPIPDSPRHMAKGIWNRMKAYGLDFDEYLFPIDRSTSGLKQLRRMDSKESMKFDKLGIPDIVRGKKVIITEDSLLTSKSLLGTVAQLEAHGADGYCFVTGQPPIIDESQIGIKSSKKYLVSREVMFGVKDIREANERMTAYFAKTFPNIKILYNTVESLAKALDVREDQIWAPRRVRMPLISK